MSADEVPELSSSEDGDAPLVEGGTSNEDSEVSEFSPLLIPAEPPAVLWHYTDAAGLLGILANEVDNVPPAERLVNTRVYRPVFHATMAEYLNDSREVVHGLEIVRAWLQELFDRTSPLSTRRSECSCRIYAMSSDRRLIASTSHYFTVIPCRSPRGPTYSASGAHTAAGQEVSLLGSIHKRFPAQTVLRCIVLAWGYIRCATSRKALLTVL